MSSAVRNVLMVGQKAGLTVFKWTPKGAYAHSKMCADDRDGNGAYHKAEEDR